MKYYVVWSGREPGIYTSWETCKKMVHGQEGASYKSFKTKEEAVRAWLEGERPVTKAKKTQQEKTSAPSTTTTANGQSSAANDQWSMVNGQWSMVNGQSSAAVCVDAACSGNPGKMEYRGIDLITKRELFHFGPVWGTNNIGEFLAIVHALAMLKQQGRRDTIFSDSRNAIAWIKQKKCKTKLAENAKSAKVYDMIRRAELWLQENTWENPIMKWDTKEWGEIPADFGRK